MDLSAKPARPADRRPPVTVQAALLPHTLFEELKALSQRGDVSLSAVIDLTILNDEQKKIALHAAKGLYKEPLFTQDPRFAEFIPHAPVLVFPSRHRPLTPEKLIERFERLLALNSDIVSGWIVSLAPPAELAQHLSLASLAFRHNGKEFILAFHDPRCVPILRRLAPDEWKQWFFGPVASWWYPLDTPTEEAWARADGLAQAGFSLEPQTLHCSEELCDALETNPFAFNLTDQLGKLPNIYFESDCFGVRLALVEQMLDEGRAKGLSREEDLCTYVMLLLEMPARAEEPRWQDAVRTAARGIEPLDMYLMDRA